MELTTEDLVRSLRRLVLEGVEDGFPDPDLGPNEGGG
jgi:hypothetical protein